ncbi:methyltransferase [Aggregatimonas sangjinii]|uniref:tRNA1(Val) (adenine(37)-N6)-methyltransferase n=1 Tax=Aggregatimonas sangjinii TaxID=2583587 RepID=A0A5B7ST32_9FLAO|nr:methyltransferase [Aggregatimonas sangjinii]QCX01352.1 methyltransferase [Aggregatimonas sangjinii]
MPNPFAFKQFTVHQDRCAMKIGTDGVLLGAWTSVETNPDSVLDIGAGTGLLALMMAQRSSAETIEALEIMEAAYEQCVENFENSPWADRLFCFHAGLDEFVAEIDEPYDLIICNPPFYPESISSGDEARDMARQNQFLPFDELLQGVSLLLDKQGTFSTILPFAEEDDFLKLAAGFSLYPKRITRVKGNPSAAFKRSLLEFRFEKSIPKISELVIEVGRHSYTEEYIALTKDFYLNM